MNADTAVVDTAAASARAGFWRRTLSFAIDFIIVILPFQILAAVLFATTAGMVQMTSGLFTICETGKSIPQALNPPPPHDSNFTRFCRVSFFGATTGAVLTVGRATREGTVTTTVSQGYMADKDGAPVNGTSIDLIFQLTFVAYLVGMIRNTGRTLGSRVVGIRVVDVTNPNASSVPLGKVIIRYLAMFIGVVPAFAVLIYAYAAGGGSADAMFDASFFRWFSITAVLGALWGIVLIVQIAMKTDPVYDRLAGTAVLKGGTPPPLPVNAPQS
jgi:uncharacterized RDD family membrane protein YckC